MDYLAAIRSDSDLFYATTDGVDPTLGVPACPEWNIADLVWHLGEVQCFWSNIIEMRATDPDEAEKAKPARPDNYAELIAWGRSQTDRMISILQATTTPRPCGRGPSRTRITPSASPAVTRCRKWRCIAGTSSTRRRPDLPIRSTRGRVRFDRRAPRDHDAVVDQREEAAARSVHIHCTDTDGEWIIQPNGSVEPIHAKGDVAVRGTRPTSCWRSTSASRSTPSSSSATSQSAASSSAASTAASCSSAVLVAAAGVGDVRDRRIGHFHVDVRPGGVDRAQIVDLRRERQLTGGRAITVTPASTRSP